MAEHAGTKARFAGVDWLRLLAFAAVVVIHSGGQIPGDSFARVVFLDATRFAVPCFFVLSGYFSASSSPWWRASLKLLKKLTIPFLLWFVFYNWELLGKLGESENLMAAATRLGQLLWMGGNGWQLWFVPALVLGTAVAQASLAALGWRSASVLLLALYGAALVLGPYDDAVFGQSFSIGWSRNGVLMAPIYVFVGMVLRHNRDRLTQALPLALAVAVLGFVIHFVEARVMNGMNATGSDFYLGTLPWAAGLSALALGVNFRASACVSELALASFGAYLAHVFLIRVYRYYWDEFGPVWQIVFTIAASLLITLIYRLAAAYVKRLWGRGQQKSPGKSGA